MGLWELHKEASKEFTIRSHDRIIVPLLLVAAVLLRITPDDLVLLISHSPIFQAIVSVNPFATRMMITGNKPEYALFCYGMATILIPYYFYILFNSPDLRNGVAKRYEKGGRAALRNSALFCVVAFAGMFLLGNIKFHHPISRLAYFTFYSKNGIVLMSVGFTYLLVIFVVGFLLYTAEFFRYGEK